VPSCDTEGICSKTGKDIDDPVELMAIDNDIKDAVYLWNIITSISRIDTITKKGTKKDEYLTVPIRTLEKMEVILDSQDWKTMSITKEEAVNLISIFHIIYNDIAFMR